MLNQALRGSADSFGIITRFYLQTVAAPERVVLFSLDIPGIVDDVDEATAAFLHIQNAVQDSEKVDRYLSFGFYIHDRSWTIWGVYLGDESQFKNQVSVARLLSSNNHRIYHCSLNIDCSLLLSPKKRVRSRS